MYLNFYNFRQEPFHITPDPEFLYLSPSHKEALASIIYGVEQRKGFVAITGEVGVGKTTILRSDLENVDKELLKPIYVFNANVSFHELLTMVFEGIGISPGANTTFEMVNQLHHILIEEYKQNRNVVLIIDEAQNMPFETLENLRMLSNLETSKDKLLQIVLIGQPELDRRLNLNELRQLRQRIAIRCKIVPLTQDESLDYVHYRISKVAIKKDPIFTKGALKRIVKQAKGIPRTINILCDNALITGFGYHKKPISKNIVGEVIADFEGMAHSRRFLRWGLISAIMIVLSLVMLWMYPLGRSWDKSVAKPSSPSKSLDGSTESASIPTPSEPSESNGIAPQTEQPREKKIEKTIKIKDTNVQGGSAVIDAQVKFPIPQVGVERKIGAGVKPITDKELLRTHANTQPVTWVANKIISLAVPRTIPRADPAILQEKPFEPATKVKPAKVTARPFPATRVVEKGDTLYRLVFDVYGVVNEEMIRSVQQKNPQITDINHIEVGHKIVFPAPDTNREPPASQQR